MNVRVGEVYYNPRCAETVVIRQPAAVTGGQRTIMDVYARPGGAVLGEHVHPFSEERFTLVRGRLRFSIGGRAVTLDEPGQSILIQPGIKHRWWNSSGTESYHICEVRNNSARWEELVLRQLFGLAQEGKTNPEGMPRLLQQAVTTLEYADVVRFTKVSWLLQSAAFRILAPLARSLGYRGCYAAYQERRPEKTVELEELPWIVRKWHYPEEEPTENGIPGEHMSDAASR